MEIRTIKPARGNRSFLGFYTAPANKSKVMGVAQHYGVTVSEVLDAFAQHADVLCMFVPLGEERPAAKNETR